MQVVIKDETIWCTQKAMSRLFGVDKSGISRHISNIFKDGELQQDATVAKIATVVNRGIRGEVEESVDFYNPFPSVGDQGAQRVYPQRICS